MILHGVGGVHVRGKGSRKGENGVIVVDRGWGLDKDVDFFLIGGSR